MAAVTPLTTAAEYIWKEMIGRKDGESTQEIPTHGSCVASVQIFALAAAEEETWRTLA